MHFGQVFFARDSTICCQYLMTLAPRSNIPGYKILSSLAQALGCVCKHCCRYLVYSPLIAYMHVYRFSVIVIILHVQPFHVSRRQIVLSALNS